MSQGKKITDEIKLKVTECYLQGKPYVDIIKQFNISRTSIDNIVNAQNIPRTRRQLSAKCDKNEVCRLYEKNKTTREVAKEIGISYSRVGEIVKEANISRKKQPREFLIRADVKHCLPFSNEFINYLDGLVISDGSLNRQSKAATAFYSQTCVNLEWLLAIQKEFTKNNIESHISDDIRIGRRNSYVLVTPVYNEFFHQYNKWYKDEKIIPPDLCVSDKSFLKNWIYGDGTLLKNTTLRLCTDSFSEQHLNSIAAKLNHELDIRFTKVHMGLAKTGLPKIRLALCKTNGLKKLYDYLGNCDHECFQYKWLKDLVKITLTCEQCGNSFIKTIHNNRKWCSKKCCARFNHLKRKENIHV